MKSLLVGLLTTVTGAVLLWLPSTESGFVVSPYLQNPAPNAMTIIWLTRNDTPGNLIVKRPDGSQVHASTSIPVLAKELSYHATEIEKLPGGKDPGLPYLHRIRVNRLHPGTMYHYTLTQEGKTFSRQFRTAPSASSSIRFVVYGDSETEPESTSKKTTWPMPFDAGKRLYVVDQTEGYRQNINVMKSRKPDFIAIVGDLVETGGEQRDWDEFWRHNAGGINDIASTTPIFPAVGNHENYSGPGGGYSADAARRALDKYQTYFETPGNNTGISMFEDRFYRIDYGPITLITIDTSDGLPHQSGLDTNFSLLGEKGGGEAPNFNRGSTQYKWLESELFDAQKKSRFTFVQFHHVPYSVGPHGFPAGSAKGQDTQSGQPLRGFSSLFEKYGVDAVFCGHDEMYEHSIVNGIHYYDVGIGGDGLRKPSSGKDGSTRLPSANTHQVFLAHLDAPEAWNGKQLVSGGKHYGHLEVNVASNKDGAWKAELTPVYVFPKMNTDGDVVGWERRIYDDVVVLQR